MPMLSVIAVTSRTATVLLAPKANHFSLPEPVPWVLRTADGTSIATGLAGDVPLFLAELEPDTAYTCETFIGDISFQTKPCSGVVTVTDFGADPSEPDNAEAFARAIAEVPAGGTLRVPSGRFLTRPIFLKDDMTLYLAKDAVIAGLGDRADWPILPSHDSDGRVLGSWEGQPEPCFAAPITAVGCDSLTITGPGTIDGGGDRGDWWDWPKETREGARRPRTMFLAHCQNVVLSGFRVMNSPSWTVHPIYCDGLMAAALRIENPPDSPNTDGFNPECCLNSHLIGLKISVGDDCIAVKSGKRGPGDNAHLAPTRHLEISNCLMERGHGAVVLGSEMSGDISDVTIAHSTFVGTDRGLRIKTRRGRGGRVSGVVLKHVEMDGVATPLAINAFYFCDPDGRSAAVQSRDPAPMDHTTPRISDITIQDVVARNVHHAAAAFLGLPEAPFSDIKIVDYRVSFDPEATAGVPLMASNVPAERHAGILSNFSEVHGDLTMLAPEEMVSC